MELWAFSRSKCEDTSALGLAWEEIIGERVLVEAVFADYGMGEECIGFLRYKDDTYEVGVGEALRPYQRYYSGKDREEASAIFIREMAKRRTTHDDL